VSKYFNETQKTDELLEQERAGRLDLAAIVENLRAPRPLTPEPSEMRPAASIQVEESFPREVSELDANKDVHKGLLTMAPSPVVLNSAKSAECAPATSIQVEDSHPREVSEVDANKDVHEGILTIASSHVVLNGAKSAHYAMEAYRALRTRLMRLQASKGLRSVAMSSTVPGEGKTITTLNLGLCFAQLHGMPVLLIDADLRTKHLTQRFENASGPGVSEIMSGEASYEDVVRKTENPNLYLVAAGSAKVAPPELFTGTAWSEFVARCKEKFSLILIDAPPVRPLADFELICAGCDAFLMVVRALHTQREALQQIASQIDPKKLVGVVLNRAEVHSKTGYYHQYGTYGSYGFFPQS
jgi:capsular exopolysaccharide synthesis family protein